MTKAITVAVAALSLVACRTEPRGQQWTRDSTVAINFSLGQVEVQADGPVLVSALEADLQAAVATIRGLGYWQEDINGVLQGLVIRVQTGVECLPGQESGQGPCVYAVSEYLGDKTDWSPATVTLNQRGTQLAHELLHLVKAWNNEGGNADHSSWTSAQWTAVDSAADAAYRITP